MLIGRENEIATLHGLMSSDESQFVAVYGRRRVGKTFLIREAYKSHFVFQHTGTYGATRRQQLSDFRESLYLAGMGKCAMPKTWSEAFGLLWNFLNTFPDTQPINVVVYNDPSGGSKAPADLILKRVSRLDAFSGYLFHT